MALNSLGLGFVFTAVNLGKGTFLRVQRDLQATAAVAEASSLRITRAMGFMRSGILLAAGGALGLLASFKLAGAAGEFERGIAGVGQITRATAEDLEKLRQEAIRAGIETQFSPTEAVQGLTSLGQAGLSAADSMATLQPALALAAGSLGQLGVADAAGLAVQAVKAFGIEVNDVEFAIDKMLFTTNSFNISARELPLAFGIGARGAQALNASLTDTAISLGLVRNVIPSVERASTSVAVSMERLARATGQQRLMTGFQISAINEATGTFRPFLDIIGDMIEKSKTMTEVQRSQALGQIFGARAGGGVNAILNQLTKGIKDNTGVTLKGRDAIAFLRREMEGAAGTANRFSRAILDTFEGQKILLRGSVETAAVVFGTPFAKVLKPVVTIVKDVLNILIGAFKSIPEPVRVFIAGTFAFMSALFAGVGVVLLFKGVLGLLGVTIGGILLLLAKSLIALAPLLVIIGGLVIAVKILRLAWERDIGGIATFGRDVFRRLRIIFEGLSQLFTEGGFSGAVRKELNLVQNQGLKAFVIEVFLFASRIKALFDGVKTGVLDSLAGAGPAFDRLLNSLRILGIVILDLFEGPASPSENAAAFDSMSSAGRSLGVILVGVASVIADVLGFALFAGAVAIKAFQLAWLALRLTVFGVVTSIVKVMQFMAQSITRVADAIASLIGANLGATETISRIASQVLTKSIGVLGLEAEVGVTATRGARRITAPTAPVAPRAQAAAAGMSAEQFAEALTNAAPIERRILLQVDGEVIAEAVDNARGTAAGRSFAPVPTV